jgi:hypothetical protein
MRYPHHDYGESYSFSISNRTAFEAKYGVDPATLEEEQDQDIIQKWQEWLHQREDDFVDQLHKQSKSNDPKFMLTATPEPGSEADLIKDWVKDIDGVIPQAYGHDFNSIQNTVQESKKLTPETMMYYTGIYSFYHHIGEMNTVKDVIAAGHDTSGVNMFAFGQASAPSVDALSKGPWREQAINPGEQPIRASIAALQDSIKKTETIYIPWGAMKEKSGKRLTNRFGKLVHMLERPSQSLKLDKATKEINKVKFMVHSMLDGNKLQPVVGHRITKELDYISKWVYYAYQKQDR